MRVSANRATINQSKTPDWPVAKEANGATRNRTHIEQESVQGERGVGMGGRSLGGECAAAIRPTKLNGPTQSCQKAHMERSSS
jgi:hypothetical protein